MPSSTVENYLKHIYVAAEKSKDGTVSMGTVSKRLAVTPGTATSMVKSMARDNLLQYEPRHGVTLTDDGRSAALQVLRRHRLIEFFLAQTLKMDWSEVHEEAERLEHAVSDKLIARLDDFLGNPQFDPHGDAIPAANGEVAKRDLSRLSEFPLGSKCRVARIGDQDGEFLRFASENGFHLGAPLVVVRADAHADIVEICFEGNIDSHTLGLTAAARIWVEPS